MTSSSSTLIGQAAFRHPIAPGQRKVVGHIVETPPDGEQGLAEGIGRIVGSSPPAQIMLQRLVHMGGDELETMTPLEVGVHWMFLSGTGMILSGAGEKPSHQG